MRGNGDGTFAAPVTLASLPNPYEIVSGDFNQDGKLDFAIWGYTTPGSTQTEELDVFLGMAMGRRKFRPNLALSPARCRSS